MVLCAALKVELKGESGTTNIILPCRRHGDGFKLLKDLTEAAGRERFSFYRVIEQGFLLNDGMYLDREKAFQHARDCGQLSTTTRWFQDDRHYDELYSEDLY